MYFICTTCSMIFLINDFGNCKISRSYVPMINFVTDLSFSYNFESWNIYERRITIDMIAIDIYTCDVNNLTTMKHEDTLKSYDLLMWWLLTFVNMMSKTWPIWNFHGVDVSTICYRDTKLWTWLMTTNIYTVMNNFCGPTTCRVVFILILLLHNSQ